MTGEPAMVWWRNVVKSVLCWGLVVACIVACSSAKNGSTMSNAAQSASLPKAFSCAALPAPSIVLSVEGATPDEVHERFDFVGRATDLLREAPEDAAATKYREAVIARIGADVSPRTLLERQRAIYVNSAFAREAINVTAVLDGRVGKIGKPSCVERLLFARQSARYSMIDHPTEFGAFILRRGDDLRVYMSGMDRVGQRIRREVREAVRADEAAGFTLLAHLHNHPFLFDRYIGDRMWTDAVSLTDVAGALGPSLSDAGFFQNAVDELALEGAWLTNGFDSIRITAAELKHLVTHEEKP